MEVDGLENLIRQMAIGSLYDRMQEELREKLQNELANLVRQYNAGNLTDEGLSNGIQELDERFKMFIPQTMFLDGMVKNDGGGYSFKLEKMKRLRRFLVIGCEHGTYYINQKQLSDQHAPVIGDLLKRNYGLEILDILEDFSANGLAPKYDPLILCLAICCYYTKDPNVQTKAYSLVPKICNIPTKLFLFVNCCQDILSKSRSDGNSPKPQYRFKRLATDQNSEPRNKRRRDDRQGELKKVNKEPKRSSGWGRRRRTGVGLYYTDPNKNANTLLYHMTKYKSRHNWSHQQVISYSHVKIPNTDPQKFEKDLVLKYCTKGFEGFQRMSADFERDFPQNRHDSIEEVINNINVVHKISTMKPTDTVQEDKMVEIYKMYGTSEYSSEEYHLRNEGPKPFQLVHEHLPKGFLKSAKLWQVMSEDMPMTAMIRNLGKMTGLGLFKQPDQDVNLARVVSKLTNAKLLKKARIHPVKILIALNAYAAGHSLQGDRPMKLKKNKMAKMVPEESTTSWIPNRTIENALEEAFYMSFKQPELKGGFKTGKSFMLALDVSGSMTMGGCVGCKELTPAIAACALALVTLNIEDKCEVYGFGSSFMNLKEMDIISKDMKLKKALDNVSKLNFGSTDCALPMMVAVQNKLDIDCFIVYTDNDTYLGKMHPSEALKYYREKMEKPEARMIVCGMQSNGFTIADPEDDKMMDIVGFDASVPEIISRFVKGEF